MFGDDIILSMLSPETQLCETLDHFQYFGKFAEFYINISKSKMLELRSQYRQIIGRTLALILNHRAHLLIIWVCTLVRPLIQYICLIIPDLITNIVTTGHESKPGVEPQGQDQNSRTESKYIRGIAKKRITNLRTRYRIGRLA